MNKKGMGYISLIFILFALTLGMAYSELKLNNVDTGNFTQTVSTSLRNATNINFNISVESSPEISNAINYYMNGVIKAIGEICIWITQFVENNPQAPYKLLLYCLILSIFAPIIILLFKLGIIIFLLTREYFQNRKEKKELNKYKKKR